MNCDEALQIVLDENHKERHAAISHILQDRTCLDRVDQLARAILSNIDDEISCAESRQHIASYHQWQQNPANTFPLLPDVQTHLARCPYCQLELQRLQTTINQLEGEPLTSARAQRTFDLSFIDAPLPRFTPTESIWNIEQQVRKLFEQIQIRVSETKATIASLSPQLAPLSLAGAMRSEDDLQYAALVLPDLDAKIHFQIESKPSRDGTALLTLRIFDTETNSPIPNARVSLRNREGGLIASSLTATNGELTFPRIPVDRYTIQTHYQDKTWELSISIIHS